MHLAVTFWFCPVTAHGALIWSKYAGQVFIDILKTKMAITFWLSSSNADRKLNRRHLLIDPEAEELSESKSADHQSDRRINRLLLSDYESRNSASQKEAASVTNRSETRQTEAANCAENSAYLTQHDNQCAGNRKRHQCFT